jgi:hypothetical protein
MSLFGWRLQVGWHSRLPATTNGLSNSGGTTTEVHSPGKIPKLSSTEFPRRTIAASPSGGTSEQN